MPLSVLQTLRGCVIAVHDGPCLGNLYMLLDSNKILFRLKIYELSFLDFNSYQQYFFVHSLKMTPQKQFPDKDYFHVLKQRTCKMTGQRSFLVRSICWIQLWPDVLIEHQRKHYTVRPVLKIHPQDPCQCPLNRGPPLKTGLFYKNIRSKFGDLLSVIC